MEQNQASTNRARLTWTIILGKVIEVTQQEKDSLFQ